MSGKLSRGVPPIPTRSDKEDWVLTGHSPGGHFMPMHQFSQYGELPIVSTNVETDFKGAGVGGTTLPADFFSYRGKMVETMTMGYWSKGAGSDLTLRVRLGLNGETDMLWTDAVAVTFDGGADTVGLTAHGFQNTKEVQVVSVVSTTGITLNSTYYVRNKTANAFQLSTAKTGGTILALTTNGTGTLKASTMIHQKFFDNSRLGANANGGHWEIRTMTTAMTLGVLGTVNMHGTLSLYENNSAEIVGLHNENLVLQVDTTKQINIYTTGQWQNADASNYIVSTNYMVQ